VVDFRAAATVATLVLFVPAILYFGRPVLLPLALAGVLAMVLSPLVRWLRGRGVGEGLSIALAALTLLLAVVLVAGLVTFQIAQVINDWPKISESLIELRQNAQTWLERTAGIPPDAIRQTTQSVLEQAQGIAGLFFGTVFGALATGFLTFVLVILMLLERARLAWVAAHVVPGTRRRDVARALDEMIAVSNRYLVGKLKVMGIMAAVYVAAFWLADVPYAPFLALLIALSSIVPYVGNLTGGIVAIVLALAASGGTAALVVLAVVVLAQPLENYVLEPLVVGRLLRLNPLMTVVVVILFGAVWGVIGAVIALPIAGMIKVALEHGRTADPVVILMSDEPPDAT
jgi:predicted PurR-regulated permease PerM